MKPPCGARTRTPVLHGLEQRLPEDASLACIGPAAENGSPLGSVAVDHRHGGVRGGLGLVWASKNLKYLTVRGTGEVRVHDAAALEEAREAIVRLTMASPVLMGGHGFSRWGTGALFDLINSRRMLPTDNFRKTWFDYGDQVNAPALAKLYEPRDHGCLGCHIHCRKIARDGRSLPGFETMAHFTALIGNHSPETAMEAADLCGRLGLDPISAGATLACLREITGKDYTEKTLLASLRTMAEDGELSRGALHLARTLGRPETAMTVKGLELPAFDPRGGCGLALAYAVSTRGGCHQRAYPISHEVLRKPVATDRFTFSGKARIIKLAEDTIAACDSMNACRLVFLAAGLDEYAKAMTAVTGRGLVGPIPARSRRTHHGQRTAHERRERIQRGGRRPARTVLRRARHLGHRGERPAHRPRGVPPGPAQLLRGARPGRKRSSEHSDHATTGTGIMKDLCEKYAAKLVAQGLAPGEGPDTPLVGGLDAELDWNREDPRTNVNWPKLFAPPVHQFPGLRHGLPSRTGPSSTFLAAPPSRRAIRPEDTETRTFLHDIPICA